MKSTHFDFEHSWKSLWIWFLCTFFIFGPLLSFSRSFRLPDFDFDQLSFFPSLFAASSFVSFFLFLFFAYLSFYHFFDKNKFFLFLSILVSLILPISIRFFIDQRLGSWLIGMTNYPADTTFRAYYIDNTYYAVYYIPAGVLYYFYRRIIVLQKTRLQEEKLKNEAEMKHLRTQINPHFLFNSLNNIYSLAYDKSDKILGAIEGLSSLLRYAIYEKSTLVSFAKEWSKIQQLIQIEQMRIDKPVKFDVAIADGVEEIMIPPVILMPLIENIFKHGHVQSMESPPKIKVWSSSAAFHFEAENRIARNVQKDHNRGIGLSNIRKRLDYIYEGRSVFDIHILDDTFMVKLSIPIDD